MFARLLDDGRDPLGLGLGALRQCDLGETLLAGAGREGIPVGACHRIGVEGGGEFGGLDPGLGVVEDGPQATRFVVDHRLTDGLHASGLDEVGDRALFDAAHGLLRPRRVNHMPRRASSKTRVWPSIQPQQSASRTVSS